MKKKLSLIITCFILMFNMIGVCFATETQSVVITAQLEQTDQIVSGDVTINTTEPELFHDGIKLSWHIDSENGTDLIYENERIPVVMEEGGIAKIPVEIDLSSLGLAPQKINIQFDLIDEENLFWFSSHSDIVLDSDKYLFQIQPLHVTVTSDQSSLLTSKHVDSEIYIDFGQTNLYHEGLKLSWHIVDQKGQELRFENERLPVPKPVNGISTVPLKIEFEKDGLLSGEKHFSLQLDLVDEVEGYWYSQNETIDFKSLAITYQYEFLNEFINTFSHVLQAQPILLLLNLAIDVVAVVVYIYYLRHRRRKAC